MDASRLRLGRIGYLNVLPIYYPLEHGEIEHNFSLIYGAPAELNEKIRHKQLDISVVSSIEYAKHFDRYVILPDLSISARGKVKSVLLLSYSPIEKIKVVHLTPHSHASVALLKILAKELFKTEWYFVTSVLPMWQSKTSEEPEAYLAIGDEALYWSRNGRFPYSYDLGQIWWDWIQKPFVFALWVCRKEIVEQNESAIKNSVAALIKAKNHGLSNLQKTLVQASGTSIFTLAELQEYFRLLDYNLNAENIDGLGEYFRLLFKHKIIQKMPPINIMTMNDLADHTQNVG